MWNWRLRPQREGFPKRFKIQRIRIADAMAISSLPASEIAKYFRDHPETAEALLTESYDKRFTPSTFIVQEDAGLFRVGWFSSTAGYECVRDFSDLADAATDYLLFSLGRTRWKPSNTDS